MRPDCLNSGLVQLPLLPSRAAMKAMKASARRFTDIEDLIGQTKGPSHLQRQPGVGHDCVEFRVQELSYCCLHILSLLQRMSAFRELVKLVNCMENDPIRQSHLMDINSSALQIVQ